MKPETAEWVAKAEADFVSADQILRTQKPPHIDLICFLCQQSAEKYLKARLCEAAKRFPRTHDLVVLLELVAPLEPQWSGFTDIAAALTDYAVDFRYPGYRASLNQARFALKECTRFRSAIRASLGLPAGKKTNNNAARATRKNQTRKKP